MIDVVSEELIGRCKPNATKGLCINPFDKFNLQILINGQIQRDSYAIDEITKMRKTYMSAGIDPDKLLDVHRNRKETFESVKKRLDNTPIC